MERRVRVRFQNRLEKFASQESRDRGDVPEVKEWVEESEIPIKEAISMGFEIQE